MDYKNEILMFLLVFLVALLLALWTRIKRLYLWFQELSLEVFSFRSNKVLFLEYVLIRLITYNYVQTQSMNFWNISRINSNKETMILRSSNREGSNNSFSEYIMVIPKWKYWIWNVNEEYIDIGTSIPNPKTWKNQKAIRHTQNSKLEKWAIGHRLYDDVGKLGFLKRRPMSLYGYKHKKSRMMVYLIRNKIWTTKWKWANKWVMVNKKRMGIRFVLIKTNMISVCDGHHMNQKYDSLNIIK